MEIKKTIAENHLSSHGRFGDTEIAESKYVTPGKQWHVSEREKSLMERGEGGERIVDALGSGTFNPETGKEEKWFWLAASAALGAYGAWKGGSSAASQAWDQARLAGLTMVEAKDALAKLLPAKEAKETVAREEYEFGLEDLSAKTGTALEDLITKQDESLRKKDLATPDTSEGSKYWRRIQDQFSKGQEGLLGMLGKSMGGVSEWFAGETSRLEGIMKRATFQRQAFKKQSEGWYLGKNLFS